MLYVRSSRKQESKLDLFLKVHVKKTLNKNDRREAEASRLFLFCLRLESPSQ
jgi:hypothetical protein